MGGLQPTGRGCQTPVKSPVNKQVTLSQTRVQEDACECVEECLLTIVAE